MPHSVGRNHRHQYEKGDFAAARRLRMVNVRDRRQVCRIHLAFWWVITNCVGLLIPSETYRHMAPVLTGRSVLKFLHLRGGETTLAALASTFDVDAAAIERQVRSLLAARLVCHTTDHLTLSEAGKSWCMEAFKPDVGSTMTKSADVPSASGEDWQRLEARVSSEKPQMTRNTNRMHGVQVVHVTRRREASASAAPTARQDPEPEPEPEPEPAKVVVSETAEKAPPAVPESSSHPAASIPPRVVVDRDGFVTQINGRRIY